MPATQQERQFEYEDEVYVSDGDGELQSATEPQLEYQREKAKRQPKRDQSLVHQLEALITTEGAFVAELIEKAETFQATDTRFRKLRLKTVITRWGLDLAYYTFPTTLAIKSAVDQRPIPEATFSVLFALAMSIFPVSIFSSIFEGTLKKNANDTNVTVVQKYYDIIGKQRTSHNHDRRAQAKEIILYLEQLGFTSLPKPNHYRALKKLLNEIENGYQEAQERLAVRERRQRLANKN